MKVKKQEKRELVAQKRQQRADKRAALVKNELWISLGHKEKRSVLLSKRPTSEFLLQQALICAGIGFKTQVGVGGFWIDFRIIGTKIGIEVDGGYHLTEEQKEKDAKRTEVLRMHGWTLLRFTNDEVTKDPQKVIRTIGKHRKPIP